MNILVDPNPLFDPKNSQFWLFLSENEIFGVSGKNELRVSMGPKCWFFCLFLFWRSAKKPTLWPRGDKKSKQKPCCVFTNFSKFFYLYVIILGDTTNKTEFLELWWVNIPVLYCHFCRLSPRLASLVEARPFGPGLGAASRPRGGFGMMGRTSFFRLIWSFYARKTYFKNQ